MTITRRLAFVAAFGAALAPPAFAQAPPQRLRGTIVSLTGDILVLHGSDGANTTITLAPDVGYRSITKATLADVKPGGGIGIVSRGPANKQEAVAIQIFVPGAPFRQAQLGWDMMPESTMTNGVVEGQAVATGGGHLKVTVDGKPVEMTIAPNVSVGAAGPGDKSLVVPGAKAVVFATKDGAAYTGRVVIVGKDGMTPPL
jgi:hypothetical protein